VFSGSRFAHVERIHKIGQEIGSQIPNTERALDIVLRILAIVLFVTVVWGGWLLSTQPVTNKGIWTYQQFPVFWVKFEFAHGTRSLSGLFEQAASLVSLLCFSTLSVVSLHKASSGSEYCGGFDLTNLNPCRIFSATELPAPIAVALCRAKDRKLFVSLLSIHDIAAFTCFGLTVLGFTTAVLICRRPAKIAGPQQALEKVRNIRVSRFVPGTTEPIQVEWVSQTLNVRMFSTQDQVVLWDIQNKVKKTKSLSSGSIETTPVSSEVLARVKESIVGMLGLMAFSNISDVPEGAKWNRVDDKDVEVAIDGTEVYDLLWTKNASQAESHKWRYFVDTRTNLPRRIEIYLKKALEENYTLYKYEAVTYLSDAEIKALIQSTFD